MPAPYSLKGDLKIEEIRELVEGSNLDFSGAFSYVGVEDAYELEERLGYDDHELFQRQAGETLVKAARRANLASEAATRDANTARNQGEPLPDEETQDTNTAQAPSNAGSQSGSGTAIQPSNTSTAMKPSDDTPTTPITPSITSTEG